MSIETKVTEVGLRTFGDEMTAVEYAGFIPSWLRRFVLAVSDGRYSATAENLTDHMLLEYGFPHEPFDPQLSKLDYVEGEGWFIQDLSPTDPDRPLPANIIFTVLGQFEVILFDYGITGIAHRPSGYQIIYRFD